MRDDRPMRYLERADDGTETVVYRASSLGACERAIVATAGGVPGAPKPAWFQEVLDEGSICEGDIAQLWEHETGIPTVNEQAEVELEIGEIDGRRIIVRGHIDGEGAVGSVLREFKKFRESTWPNFQRQGIEVNRNYPWQVSIYMLGRGLSDCEFVGGHVTGYRDENGELHDTPRDDDWPTDRVNRIPVVGEVECKRITAPPIPLKDIRKRIIRLERLINTGFDATEVTCNKAMYPCPFFKLHDEDETTEFELPKNDKTSEVIGTLVAVDTRLAELRREIAQHEKVKKQAVTELRELVGALGPHADAAKKLTYDRGGSTVAITRKRYHQPEATRRAYDVDSFTIAKGK